MAHMDVSDRRRATRLALGFALAAALVVGSWLAASTAAIGSADAAEYHPSMQVMAADVPVVDGAGGSDRNGDGGLAATGSAQNQLLILGAAMMLAGGIAAYAVSRRHGAGHH